MEMVQLVDCPRCGQTKPADAHDKHLCEDCAKAEANRYMYLRQHQGDWMKAAEDAGIEVWLRQPGETTWEYTVWMAYRDMYPGRKPSYVDVARQLNTTHNVVKKIAQRWTFQARMQAWMTECDRITMLQRHEEIIHMNAEHIDMAQRLRNKLSQAIDLVDPALLKPGELGTLLKLTTDLERKARVDEAAESDMRVAMLHDTENPDLRQSPTKQNDLSEVVQILLNAGALGSVTQIGVRETTTREVVMTE